jgi:hypothetical protein
VLVQGSGNLLQQLYHESDLIGWGASIDFPCFMTVCAKEATSFDFASLIHRFVRSESASPLLLLSGASPSQRHDLWRRLKPLLLPAFSDVVKGIEEPDAVVEALWRHHEACQCASPPPALDEVNCRLHRAYDRLDVPFHLRQNEYSCQFHKRDPLMLLLTKETFGCWAPNRVACEIQGRDIFRTFAMFSCVDGIVCGDDALWIVDAESILPAIARPDSRR